MNTEANDLPTEDAITRLRFRMDGLRERVRRIWAAMHGEDERAPLDYPHWDDERRILINIIRKQTDRGSGGNYTEGGGERALLKWLLGLSATLIVVSIVGGVSLFGKVSAIEANQASQATQAARMQNQIDQLAGSVQELTRRP